MYAEISPRLSDEDVADAERWLIKNALVEQALRAHRGESEAEAERVLAAAPRLGRRPAA